MLILATAFAQLSYPHLLDRTKSAFILVLCALLLIPSVYKLATTHQQYHWVHSSSAFYILVRLACTLFLLPTPSVRS